MHIYYPQRANRKFTSQETNLNLPFEKEHSKNQKKLLEMKNLRIKIQMATEALEEKKKTEWEDKKKKNVDKKIRSIQEAQYMTKKSSTERDQRN